MPDHINIAIADDHVMFRKGLIRLINHFPGCNVCLDVSNGKQLIEQINPENPPAIILMDIAMPEMDGYSATEWLRHNLPQVKIIALTTMDSETAIIKMIKSGAKGYILKDADPEELHLALKEVLRQGYFYNEQISRKVVHAVSNLSDTKNAFLLFSQLSPREVEFLKYCCTELTYKEIAEKMFLSVRTVEGYRDSLFEKLELKSRSGLVIYAIKNQIVNLADL